MSLKHLLEQAILAGDSQRTKQLLPQVIGNSALTTKTTNPAGAGKVISALTVSDESAISACCRFFEEPTESTWRATMPLVHALKATVRNVRKAAKEQKALDVLRGEYAWLRRDARSEKRLLPMLFAVLLEIVKISDNPLVVDPLLKTSAPIDALAEKTVPKSILAPLMFYWAKHLLFTNHLAEAGGKFLRAFELLNDVNYKRERRRILLHLIPLRLAQGSMPSKQLLTKYDLGGYLGPIVKNVLNGNLKNLTSALANTATLSAADRQAVLDVGTVTFGLMELVAFRNLIRRCAVDASRGVWSIEQLAKISSFAVGGDFSKADTTDLVAHLIERGMLVGRLDLSTLCVTIESFPAPPWSLELNNYF
jgi:hypothetical protein